MGESLTIEMLGSKLCRILELRADYHARRASWFRVEIEELSEDPFQGEDPLQALRNAHRDHEDKATFFLMLMENIVPDVTYRLTEQNYMRLSAVEIWVDPEKAAAYSDRTDPEAVRYVYGYSMRTAIAHALREARVEGDECARFEEEEITAIIERVEEYLKGK